MNGLENNEWEMDTLGKPGQRGIYLLPNLLTTMALFAGFYSIVAAMKGRFETAAMAIFIAMLADSLDGRVARMTNTQSAFGAQYDSLSDMVASGLAPALVLYSWSLTYLGKIGWLAAFLYAAATALRLARFNVIKTDKNYFQGLPCPSAAGVIASVVWLGSIYGFKGQHCAIAGAIISVCVSLLMVSTIRYSSFKSMDMKGKVPFFTIVLTVLVLIALALQPAEMLFGIFSCYVLSGPLLVLKHWRKLKQLKQRK